MKDILEGVLAPFSGGFSKPMNRGVDRDGRGSQHRFIRSGDDGWDIQNLSILNGLLDQVAFHS